MGLFSDLEKELTAQAKAGPVKNRAAWINSYLQASFRGVEFFIEGAETTGGRRIQSHAFPSRDDLYHEDLGRAEREFRFSGYIIGDSYFQHRENLIAALEAEGPGKLVHPYRGIFDVVVKNFTMRETTGEGRLARFDMSFSEQRRVELTTAVVNTKENTREKKKDLIDSLQAEFEAAYNIGQMAVSGVQDALAAIDRGLDVILAAKRVVSTASDFQRELSNVKGKLVQFALDSKLLGASLLNLVNFGTDTGATAENSIEQLREMGDIYRAMQINPSNTPDEIYLAPDYAANQVQVLIAQAAIGGAIGLTSKVNYETVEQAQEVQQTIFSLLDDIFENPNTPDTVFEAARAAKAAVVEDLAQEILDLASLVNFEISETSNSLVISNTIYGGVDKESEILKRNQILHPMFISAGVPIKVVVDA